MLEDYKKEILISSLEGRKKEVTEYQVNIDNFKLAIERISDDDEKEFVEFKNHLKNLLKANLLEQRKAQIMLDVIQSQLET